MTLFVDASVIVAIIAEEPGFEELEKGLEGAAKIYVSPMVRLEAVAALTRIYGGHNSARTPEIFDRARAVVDAFCEVVSAREIAIDSKIGSVALDAMATYGRLAGHAADLNLGDCLAYAAAKTYRLKLAYRGNDFALTDMA